MPETARISVRLKSHDPHTPVADVVRQIDGALPELTERLKRSYEIEDVRLEREATFPVDAHTISITFQLLGAAIVGGIGKKIGEDIYAWLKGRWIDLRVDVEPISITGSPGTTAGADKT